jgi:hypothetical protein
MCPPGVGAQKIHKFPFLIVLQVTEGGVTSASDITQAESLRGMGSLRVGVAGKTEKNHG